MSGVGRGSGRWRARGVVLWVIGVTVLYVGLGNALHRWVFPLPAPDPATYPRAGDEFASEFEGFRVRNVDVVDGAAVTELERSSRAPRARRCTTTGGSPKSSSYARGSDTHLAGPPWPVVAGMDLLLAPAARLLGFTNYDPIRALHPAAAAREGRS